MIVRQKKVTKFLFPNELLQTITTFDWGYRMGLETQSWILATPPNTNLNKPPFIKHDQNIRTTPWAKITKLLVLYHWVHLNKKIFLGRLIWSLALKNWPIDLRPLKIPAHPSSVLASYDCQIKNQLWPTWPTMVASLWLTTIISVFVAA